MSTKAGTIEVRRPSGFTLWATVVSVLAAAAVVMSTVALIQAERTPTREVASVSAPLWDASKLEAMEGRVLAASVGSHGTPLWDAYKLEAMEGRVLSEPSGPDEDYQLWDPGKIEAMEGRVLAEG